MDQALAAALTTSLNEASTPEEKNHIRDRIAIATMDCQLKTSDRVKEIQAYIHDYRERAKGATFILRIASAFAAAGGVIFFEKICKVIGFI